MIQVKILFVLWSSDDEETRLPVIQTRDPLQEQAGGLPVGLDPGLLKRRGHGRDQVPHQVRKKNTPMNNGTSQIDDTAFTAHLILIYDVSRAQGHPKEP